MWLGRLGRRRRRDWAGDDEGGPGVVQANATGADAEVAAILGGLGLLLYLLGQMAKIVPVVTLNW